MGFVAGADDAKYDGLAQFTITTWINLQGDPSNDRLISKQTGGAFDGFSLHLDGTAGDFGVRMFNGGSTGFAFDVATGSFDAANKWLFLAVTYDGNSASANTNYYSGTQASGIVLSHTTTINAGVLNDNASRVIIGGTDAAPTATNTAPPAYIDDIRVYSGLLDSTALDAVRLQNIPEPSTYAVIFGGLALLVAGVRRVRRNRAC